MKIPLPNDIVINSCLISGDIGCLYSDIIIEYRGKEYLVSDRNFMDHNLCYLHKYDGLPVNINDCLIDESLVKKIRKEIQKWAKIKKIKLKQP